MLHRARLLLTLGDVAGIGPEVILKAWPRIVDLARPIVVGDTAWLDSLIGKLQLPLTVLPVLSLQVGDETMWTDNPEHVSVIQGTKVDLSSVKVGKLNALAGKAAYDFLTLAIELTSNGMAEGIVTAPLNKAALHQAGLAFPGHTEILADKTGTKQYAMMLLTEQFGVVHVTLHVPFREVAGLLTMEKVLEKIRLLHVMMNGIKGISPRIAVCGLNPHAGDQGIFGDEEERIITPAIALARKEGIDATGPWPSEMIFVKAYQGGYDGIVAMYHDQGHIPVKLKTGLQAVNVTCGLPFVRTSVAHGTAYDIADRFIADPESMVQSVKVASRLVSSGKHD